MKRYSVILLSAALLTGCSKPGGWSLSGGAPDSVDTIYIQAPTYAGGWYDLDSTIVKNGKYSFNLPKANGTIYRVKGADYLVYVPADSTETLSLSANGIRSGSAEAELFNRIDSLSGDSRELLKALDGNYATTAAYYATRLNKDYRLLRTVANRFHEERPNDPRTAILKAELVKKIPKSTPTEQQVILAEEINYFEIELIDRNGQLRKLSETVVANPLVVLAYVDFSNSDVPAITRALGDSRNAGAEIYEVGFEENQHLWANASEGLPWVNVYQSDAAPRVHINQYAVASFPTFFIFKNGEIVDRITDYTKLSETVKNLK